MGYDFDSYQITRNYESFGARVTRGIGLGLFVGVIGFIIAVIRVYGN